VGRCGAPGAIQARGATSPVPRRHLVEVSVGGRPTPPAPPRRALRAPEVRVWGWTPAGGLR